VSCMRENRTYRSKGDGEPGPLCGHRAPDYQWRAQTAEPQARPSRCQATALRSRTRARLLSRSRASKLDVVDYYVAVAEPIMRATSGRPAMLQRFPMERSGIPSSKACAQRRARLAPDDRGLDAERHDVEGARHCRPGSRRMGRELGCLGFHLWPFLVEAPSTRRAADRSRPPTRVVFDQVREAASCVKELFDELGVVAYRRPAAIVAAHLRQVESRWDSTDVRAAAVAFARELERRHPDLITANWWKEERGQRVFVDFNQNAPTRRCSGRVARSRSYGQVSTPSRGTSRRGGSR